MGKEEVLAGLQQELRRGSLVLCVLACVTQPVYGYNLVTELNKEGIPVEANTLYPLLRRLEGQGLLQSQWETAGAKPRKYYLRTQQGTDTYQALKQQWEEMANHMAALFAREQQEENHGE